MMNRYAAWLAVGTVLWCASTSFVFLRLNERRRKARLKQADYVTICAWSLSIFFLVAYLFYGTVIYDLAESAPRPSVAIAYLLFNLSHVAVVPIIKISIILLYLSLRPSRWQQRLLYALLVFSVARLVAFFFITLFGCYYAQDGLVWNVVDQSRRERQCIPQRPVILINGITSTMVEIALFLLALPFLHTVRSSFSAKFGLFIGFAMGLVTIAGTLTTTVFTLLAWTSLEDRDFVAAGGKFFGAGMAATVEVNVGLAIASILPLRRAIVKFLATQFARMGLTQRLGDAQSTASRFKQSIKSSPVWPGQNAGPTRQSTRSAELFDSGGVLESGARQEHRESGASASSGSELDTCEYADTLRWPMRDLQFPDLNTLRRGSVSALQIVKTRTGNALGLTSTEKVVDKRKERGSVASLWSHKSAVLNRIDESEVRQSSSSSERSRQDGQLQHAMNSKQTQVVDLLAQPMPTAHVTSDQQRLHPAQQLLPLPATTDLVNLRRERRLQYGNQHDDQDEIPMAPTSPTAFTFG
ncbi:hypothetical protein PYCC9005_002587 [Savitreella phatthalungensis]